MSYVIRSTSFQTLKLDINALNNINVNIHLYKHVHIDIFILCSNYRLFIKCISIQCKKKKLANI